MGVRDRPSRNDESMVGKLADLRRNERGFAYQDCLSKFLVTLTGTILTIIAARHGISGDWGYMTIIEGVTGLSLGRKPEEFFCENYQVNYAIYLSICEAWDKRKR